MTTHERTRHPAGPALRAFCKEAGTSMRALSLKIGRGEKFVADIVSGKNRFPDPAALAALAELTGIPNDILSPTAAPHSSVFGRIRAGHFFDAVIAAVEAAESLSPEARKDINDDVRHYCTKWLHRDPSAVPADPRWLREQTKHWTAETFDVGEKRFANVNYAVRKALRISGTIPVDRKPARSLSPEWRKLDRLVRSASTWVAPKLSAFIRYCDTFGIAPTEVSDETLAAFASYRDAFDLGCGTVKKITAVRTAWNNALSSIEGWPGQRLSAGRVRTNLNLPEEAFSESFRRDMELYKSCRGMRGYDKALSGTHLERARAKHAVVSGTGMRRRRRIQPLKDSTLEQHVGTLWFAASAMVRLGETSLDEIRSIADIADVAVADQVVTDVENRLGLESQYAGSLVKTLGSVAKRWVPDITAQELDDFSALKMEVDDYVKNLGRLSDRDRTRLAPFLSDPENMATLLALPYWTFEDLERTRSRSAQVSYEMALRAQSAIAVLIEETLPVRWGDLGTTSFDVNVMLPQKRGRAGTLHYSVRKTEERGVTDVSAALSPEKVRLLEIYRRHYHPVLARHDPATSYVFPGAMPGTRKSYGQLSRQVKNLVFEATGHVINGHLWRKVMGGYLIYVTHDKALVRALLGHAENSQATNVYVEFEAAWAAAELDSFVTRLVAQAYPPRRLREKA